MKKVILIFAVMFSFSLMGQITTTTTTEKTLTKPVVKNLEVKDSIMNIVKVMKPEQVVETILVKDSAIQEQAKVIETQKDSIVAKTNEVNDVKENSIPVGNGNGIYILIVVAIVLVCAFLIAKFKKNIGKFLTINEKDLIKGVIMAFVSSALTTLINILNTGVFPTDWKTWSMILTVGLTAGLTYLLKNLFTSTDKKTTNTTQATTTPTTEPPATPVA